MKKSIFILLTFFITSCSDSKWNGEWGATVGDCDEICTIYYSAQRELMKNKYLSFKNFPNKTEQRDHVSKFEKGHKIDSWFNVIDSSDTTVFEFYCEVIYDKKKIGYVIKNLKTEKFNSSNSSNKIIENDTIKIQLEYYGWGCPCPQWITKENQIIYESNKSGKEKKKIDLFWNIKPANETLPHPFDLTDDMENLRFEFIGQFYAHPQFLGIEGEQAPAKTFRYYSVKHLK